MSSNCELRIVDRGLQPRRGVTLLELLVVVSVIAILGAILLPGLGQARQESRRAVCLANLHQVGLATEFYLDDNRGAYWRYYRSEAEGRRWWFGFEADGPGAGQGRPLDKSRAVLAPYLGTHDRLQCPAFPYSGGCYFPKFAARSASYGFNLYLGPVNPRMPTARRDQFAASTSSVFVFADGAHFDFNPGMNEGHYIIHERDVRRPSGYGHFRHRGRAMVLYMDGHSAGQPLRGPAHPVQCGGPAGNLSSPGGGTSIYGPGVGP